MALPDIDRYLILMHTAALKESQEVLTATRSPLVQGHMAKLQSALPLMSAGVLPADINLDQAAIFTFAAVVLSTKQTGEEDLFVMLILQQVASRNQHGLPQQHEVACTGEMSSPEQGLLELLL